MKNPSSDNIGSGSIKHTTLESNGDNWKVFIADFYNYILIKYGPDLHNFMQNGILPRNHTQHSAGIHRNDFGTFVINEMPNMLGTWVLDDVEISMEKYKAMVPAEREGIIVRVPEPPETPESSQALKERLKMATYFQRKNVNVPVVYTAMYVGDPYANERVKVSAADHAELSRFEISWVSMLGNLAGFMNQFLSRQLTLSMEGLTAYLEHRAMLRPDMMIKDIRSMVLSRGMTEVEPLCQYNNSIMAMWVELQRMRLVDFKGHGVDRYLEAFDLKLQKMKELGFTASAEIKPEGEDTISYMVGLMLIHSVGGDKFDECIRKADIERQLRAPTCSYEWAVAKVKEWNATIANSYDTLTKSGLKRKHADSEEVPTKGVRIAAAKTYDHANQKSSGTARGSGGKDKSTERAKGIADYKAKYKCDHCGTLGHYGSECRKATADEKAKYLKEGLERRALKRAEFHKNNPNHKK